MDTIARIKLIRLYVTRYLAGQSEVLPTAGWIRLDAEGLPNSLGSLKALVKSPDPNAHRLLLTLLRVSSVIDARGKVDLQSIINPPKQELNPDLIGEYITVLKSLNWTIDVEQLNWTTSHLTTKTGPNGPALLSSIIELHHLPESLIKAIGLMGGSNLLSRMETLKSAIPLDKWADNFKLRVSPSIRKLSVIHDPEAKERVIAILDY